MSGRNKYLKVGLVLDTSLDVPDGVQQYIIDIGEWLVSQGHDVHYLVGETKRSDMQNIHSLSKNIGVKFNGNRTTIPLPTNRKKIDSFLDKEGFDVLHVQMPYSPFLAQRIILSAAPKTAIVGTFHIVAYSKWVSMGAKLLSYWLRPSLKKFDQVVSTSSASASFALEKFGIKSTVLPCVIDYDRFNSAKPLSVYDDDVKTILFLGRLVPRKGCELLIEAVRLLKLKNDVPRFRLVICGKGPLEHHLRNLITANNLDDVVSMVGFVEENIKPSYYASADISVFPSSGGESFGIVLLEAMASGRSVVLAGDNSGYKTVMSPRPGLLFNPNDATQLAEKLQKYLSNPTNTDTLDWEEKYSKEFDINTIGTQLVGIYYAELAKNI